MAAMPRGKATLDRFVDAWNARDLDGIMASMTTTGCSGLSPAPIRRALRPQSSGRSLSPLTSEASAMRRRGPEGRTPVPSPNLNERSSEQRMGRRYACSASMSWSWLSTGFSGKTRSGRRWRNRNRWDCRWVEKQRISPFWTTKQPPHDGRFWRNRRLSRSPLPYALGQFIGPILKDREGSRAVGGSPDSWSRRPNKM